MLQGGTQSTQTKQKQQPRNWLLSDMYLRSLRSGNWTQWLRCTVQERRSEAMDETVKAEIRKIALGFELKYKISNMRMTTYIAPAYLELRHTAISESMKRLENFCQSRRRNG